MMIEVITFGLPENMSKEELLNNYKETSPKWRGVKELIRKSYLYDEDARLGGGIYHWKNEEAAEHWHGEEWRKSVIELYGSDPMILRFNVPIVADNELDQTVEF